MVRPTLEYRVPTRWRSQGNDKIKIVPGDVGATQNSDTRADRKNRGFIHFLLGFEHFWIDFFELLSMNKGQMSKNVGQIVQLRPLARRISESGDLPYTDFDWRIENVDDNCMRLSNLVTGHTTLLSYDQIHSYMSNPNRDTDTQKHGFLQLRVQIFLLADSLKVEPLPPGDWGFYEVPEQNPLEKIKLLMPDLISEMQSDLKQNSFIREFFLVRKTWAMNYGDPCFAYFFEDHENLLGKVQILENSGLVIDVTPGNAKKYRMMEPFVEYLLSS